VPVHGITVLFLPFCALIAAHTAPISGGHSPIIARQSMASESEIAVKSVLTEGGELKGEEAAKLEEEYVHKVYDVIAPHFSHTRHSPWPKVINAMFFHDCSCRCLQVTGVHACEIIRPQCTSFLPLGTSVKPCALRHNFGPSRTKNLP
jgi:hypothetical protein